jgi:PKD repeat protein
MKKIYSFLIALIVFASFQTNAQQSCSAIFTTQIINNSTIKFNPSPLTLDSPSVRHFWSFINQSSNYFNYSYSVSPTIVFPTGIFTVGHRVYRNGSNGTSICSDSTTQTITITQGACLLSTFFYKYTSQSNYLEHYYYNYTNNLSPTDSIRWTFGDGSNSNSINPTHVFANTGVYNVCLRIIKRNLNGSLSNCVSEYCKLDTVAYQCNLQAYFQPSTDSAITNNAVQFFNYSSGYSSTDSLTWNFGDGTPVSHSNNPTHVYANAGVYMVCLYVKKNGNPAGTIACRDTVCRTINISSSCNLSANFTSYRDSLITIPNSYHFTNTTVSLSSTDSIRWTFGDGTSSNQLNPNHAYTSSGTFNVCLRVIKRNANGTLTNCVSEKCYPVVIAQINTCNLQSNFTWYSDSLYATPLNNFHFTNTSVGLSATDSIRWTFGDGFSSNQANPNHIYFYQGNYTVCLRIIKRNVNGTLTNCVSEKCYPIIVTINPCDYAVYFSSYVDSLQSNTIHFTNHTGPFNTTDSTTWTFGDGTVAHSIDADHTYINSGTYTVCLKIRRPSLPGAPACERSYCKVITVTVPCTLVSNFSWRRDSLPTVALNTIRFTNLTTPLSATDSIRWTFGDGTTSNQINPVHVYAQQGTYNVCLRVIKRTASGALTNCVSEKCYTVTVVQVCNLSAAYSMRIDSSNYKNIIFTNTTVTPNTAITALWNFGDGTTATSWNATHLYAQPGRYNVCLRIQYGTCVSYKCDTINIVAPISCTDLSNFQFTNGNGQVSFAPTFYQSNVQYTWTFGDGTGAQGMSAAHYYNTAGTYTACLTAFKNNNCASTTCKTITILPIINCNNITLSIGDVRDSLVPNRIKFTALSNTATTSQQWTITKIPTSATQTPVVISSNNPTYMFLDSGYYNVCVKATYANGCIKTICKTVYISQNMPGTNVCSLQVFPNPTSTVINATVTLVQPQLINATVYNSSNNLVLQKQQQGVVGLNTINMNVANLPAGIYTIRVLYGGQVCYASFIKQ